MRILALEPYPALSHRLFLEGLAERSRHEIELAELPARRWKWRMRTASLAFAERVAAARPDLLLASDYTNLAELFALLPPGARDVPAIVCFHENQLTYPLQPGEARDLHFALVHAHAILAAERAVFFSDHHRQSFLGALADLLRGAPDLDATGWMRRIEERSLVLPLGTDAPRRAPSSPGDGPPVVLWAHRWEYDKDPDALVACVAALVERGIPFRLRVLGQRFREAPPAFARLRAVAGERLEACGFVPERAAYLDAVAGAQIALSTARHEFFGLSTLEALRAGLMPVVPADLAYRELLPAGDGELAAHALWPRADGPLATIERALAGVADGSLDRLRERAAAGTDRFAWDAVAPRWDALFEEVRSGRAVPDARPPS